MFRSVTGSTPPSDCFDDSELAGELHERRVFVDAHGEREMRGVFQRAAGIVANVGGQLEGRARAIRERRSEGDGLDDLRVLVIGDLRSAHVVRRIREGELPEPVRAERAR